MAEKNNRLNSVINNILERELSGYRFVESAFIHVTDELGVEAVQKALAEGPFSGVHAHLKAAVQHLTRSKKYPNQMVFYVSINGYVYTVPFIEDDENFFLKTIIPDRKATKKYLGGAGNE